MARRKSLSFGPKRKSYKSGAMRVNTKGYRLTSTSFGTKGARLNVSKRGMRFNGKSCLLTMSLLLTLPALSLYTLLNMDRNRG